ncbi:MAG: DUF6114 domain-containing protein [Nocardioides sp.]
MTTSNIEPSDATRVPRTPTSGRGDALGLPRRLRLGFRHLRRTRPFWGALVLLLGSYLIAFPLMGSGFAFITTIGARALTPLLISGGIAAAALVALFAPSQRHFPALVAAMLSIASLPLANLGGWIVGMVCGIVGASMVFGWTPYSDKQLARFAEREATRSARRELARAAKARGKHSGIAA